LTISNAAQAWRLTARTAKRFGAIAALGGAIALALSYFATQGYLLAIGWQAIWLASFADYLPTALAIFPFAIGGSTLGVSFSAVMSHYSSGHQIPAASRCENVLRLLALECMVAASFLFAAADGLLPLIWPLMMLLLAVPLIGVVTLYVSELTRRLISWMTIALTAATISFASGNALSISVQATCGQSSAATFAVETNSVAGCLVWSGERGVLVVAASDRGVTFYRWDEMHHMKFRR
jgi:hypothetical protein